MPPRARRKKSQRPPPCRPALYAASRHSAGLETLFLVGLVVAAALLLGSYQYLAAQLAAEDGGPAAPREPPRVASLLRRRARAGDAAPPLPSALEHSGSRDGHHDKDDGREEREEPDEQGGYARFARLAGDLAALPPADALASLERDDPFGTRTFAARLLAQETERGRVLTGDELRGLFPCPRRADRITLPDAREEGKARDFREGAPGTFLFFQHLRKAGGTDFCTLAEKNLPRKARPNYYCMPDMTWTHNRKAGYLHSWSNSEIIKRMKAAGHRVAGNEWDNFDPSRHFDLPAVFATSFRKPLDRALSQFRFECLEDRGCHIKDVRTWWEGRRDLWNVYTKTFSDRPAGGRYRAGDGKADARRAAVARALAAVARFHVVLAMEWLAYGAPQVRAVLGFDDASALTTRVRPHIAGARRDDGQDKNTLGSASIAKASWVPQEYLDAEQYARMSEDLVLDEILTDAARRMFLERLVCEDAGGGGGAR